MVGERLADYMDRKGTFDTAFKVWFNVNLISSDDDKFRLCSLERRGDIIEDCVYKKLGEVRKLAENFPIYCHLQKIQKLYLNLVIYLYLSFMVVFVN